MQPGISVRGRSRDQSRTLAIGSIHQAKLKLAPVGAEGENISDSHEFVTLSATVKHINFHLKTAKNRPKTGALHILIVPTVGRSDGTRS